MTGERAEAELAGMKARFTASSGLAWPFDDDQARAAISGASRGERRAPPAAREAAQAAARAASGPTAAAEAAALAIVAECPHARLCACRDRGLIDCQPGGRHSGRQTPAACRACLEAFQAAPAADAPRRRGFDRRGRR